MMKRKIKQSIKWILIGRQFQFAVSLGFQLVIMRILSPEIYGVYALAVSALGLAAILVSFGFVHCIIQFQKVKDIERNVLGLTLLQALGYVLLTIPGSVIVGKIYGSEIARVYRILIFPQALTFISLVFQFTLERDLEFKKTEIILCVAKLASVLSVLGLALAGWGVYSLVAGLYVKVLLEAAIFYRYSRWRYGIGLNREVIRTVIGYAFKRFLALGSGMMMGYLDKLILGLLVPVSYVGGYERGLFIISSSLGLVGQFDSRFGFSLINRIKDDTRRLISLINKATFAVITLAAAFSLVLVFYSRDLVTFLLGGQWEETARLLPYFSIYLIALIPAGFIRQIFFAEKDPLHIVWGRLIEIAVFLALAFGIWRLTPEGKESFTLSLMALNLGFSSLAGVGYLAALLLRLGQLQPAALGKPLLLSGSAAIGGYVVFLAFSWPAPVNMAIVGVAYGFLLWRFCRPEFRWLKEFWRT